MSLANAQDENQVELIIPPFLGKSLGCFRESSVGDVSHVYNIVLKSMDNKQLFVNNEGDLRNILYRYLLYKKLCRNVQKEMVNTIKEMDNTLKQSRNKKDQSKKKVTKTKKDNKKVKGQTSIDHGSQTFSAVTKDNDQHCSQDCKHVRYDRVQEKKKKCCIIS